MPKVRTQEPGNGLDADRPDILVGSDGIWWCTATSRRTTETNATGAFCWIILEAKRKRFFQSEHLDYFITKNMRIDC